MNVFKEELRWVDAILRHMFIHRIPIGLTYTEIESREAGLSFNVIRNILSIYTDYSEGSCTYRLNAQGRLHVINRIFKDGSWLRIYRKNGLWRFIKMIFGLNK